MRPGSSTVALRCRGGLRLRGPARAAAAAALLASVSIAGCYASHDGAASGPAPIPGGADAGTSPSPVAPGRQRVFVISELTLPVPIDGSSVGANHDAVDSGEGSTDPSADCQSSQRDYRSMYDGRAGIDNAYGELVPTIESLTGEPVDEQLRDLLASGRLPLLLVLSEEEPATVSLWLARPVEPLRLGGGGRIAPGQAFEPLEELGRGRLRSAGGTRVAADIGAIPLPIPSDVVPLLPVERLQGVRLHFDREADALRAGELGAFVEVDDAVEAAKRFMPGIEATVRAVLEGVADLMPSVDPAICQRLSVGMAFEAVPALLEE